MLESTPVILLLAAALLLTCQLSAEPLGDSLSVELRADYGVEFDGYTRIRQFDEDGSRLGLSDDLGVDDWFSAGLDVAWRFDDWHSLRAGFTFNAFRGVNSIDRDIVHEGAHYPEGTQLRFDRTTWWHVEFWHGFTPWRVEYASFTLLAGVVVDFLDVWIEPDPLPPPEQRDDHENFGSAWIPLPALGARMDLYPVGGLHLAIEARGTHVENLPTWHAGGTRHWQSSFDADLQLGYRVQVIKFGVALRYRLLIIEQQNREDGNEFAISGLQAGIYLRLLL